MSDATSTDMIVVFGAAGLVGQNLVQLLKQRGFGHLVCIDKHPANTAILRKLHPELTIIEADLAEPGDWEGQCAGAAAAVMLQAQIGGEVPEVFTRNNVVATERALAALRRANVGYLVHVSSSVVRSAADDSYTRTKAMQEELVVGSGIAHCVLRPTLMFGPFDRKHLGWLSRFMERSPVFPVPGRGNYTRQPLYAPDFCEIVLACLQGRREGAYNITGREKIDYVDIIRTIRTVGQLRSRIVHIPYAAFWMLLKLYGLAQPNTPFTTKQLQALVIDEEFELIPWWDIFEVEATPFRRAAEATFAPGAQTVTLEF